MRNGTDLRRLPLLRGSHGLKGVKDVIKQAQRPQPRSPAPEGPLDF